MEINELKDIWQQYDDKLERSLQLNRKCLAMIQAQRTRSKLAPLLRIRLFEILLHSVLVWWLAGFLFHHFFEWKFALSALVLIIFYLLALVTCLKQVIIIKRIDYSDDVITIQSSLVMLETHNADYIRLGFLFMPSYLAYPIIFFKAAGGIDISMVGQTWWAWQLVFSLLISCPCIWIYRQLSYKNIHKSWVRKWLNALSGRKLADVMQFVREMDSIKKGIA
jgi:hypothetical protein